MMILTVLCRIAVYRVGKKFLLEPLDDGCVSSFVETPVASIDFNIRSTSKRKD